MSKQNKYTYYKVLQTNYGYGHGWEDTCFEEANSKGYCPPAKARLKEYRANQPEYPHRLISRRELNKVVA